MHLNTIFYRIGFDLAIVIVIKNKGCNVYRGFGTRNERVILEQGRSSYEAR